MKFIKMLSTMLLLSLNIYAYADAYPSTTSTDGDGTDTNTLLTNLGAYLGYPLATDYNGDPYAALFNVTSNTNLAINLLSSLFSALPVNAFDTTVSQFIPSSAGSSDGEENNTLKSLNSLANATYTTANYNSSDTSSSTVTVNPLIDQETYQNDPINQYILNVLGTPDYTYCMNNDASAWLSDCNYLYNYQVINNVVGTTVPSPSNFFSYSYNQNIVPQLNSNTLITPLLYDTSTAVSSSGSTGTLTATTQIQEAANFIRYATFGTVPLDMPSYQDYSSSYAMATSTTGAPQDIATAQNDINSFIANLRTYAAQSSVATSNLYYILSKRMPQPSTQNNEQTSQALNEFMMATRRFSSQPTSSTGTSWINSINTASPATVEKEIALLLNEINYQLYLNRQQEERQLLTNTMMLMLMAHQSAPQFSSSTSTGSTD